MTPEELKVIRERLELSTRVVGPATMGGGNVVRVMRQDIKTLFDYIDDLELENTALVRIIEDDGD